jgi:tRNA G18 (ribose-2'-O)-methylase SpoU
MQLTKSELRAVKSSRADFLAVKRNPIYLILDSLKVAHNVGTILRMADALLVEKVFICGNTIIPPNRKIKTSSRGAERWVPWEYSSDVLEVVKNLKEAGVSIVSLELADNSVDYKGVAYPFPVALVFCRENDGVNQDIHGL